MPLICLDTVPESIQVNVPLHVILPDLGRQDKLENYPVLFLLHGLTDDSSAWVRYSNIETVARELGLCVVMPTVGRSFYADMLNGQAYFTYVTEELPAYLRQVFKFNLEKENTLIAGNSMGGYGAFKCAVLKPEQYRAALSLSGLLMMNLNLLPPDKAANPALLHEVGMIYGGLDKVENSPNDTFVWLQMIAEKPTVYPQMTAICGAQDDLVDMNRFYAKVAESMNVPLTYIENEGTHTWPYWQAQLENWLCQQLSK